MTASLPRNLLIVSLCVVGAIGVIWFGSDKAWQAPPSRPLDPGLFAPLVILPVPATSNIPDQVAERPLFTAGRKPVPVQDDPEQLVDALGSARLLGLFQSGSRSGAIVHIDGKVRRIHIGERLGSWVLRSVAVREAAFADDNGRAASLLLKFAPQLGMEATTTTATVAPKAADPNPTATAPTATAPTATAPTATAPPIPVQKTPTPVNPPKAAAAVPPASAGPSAAVDARPALPATLEGRRPRLSDYVPQ